MSWLSQLFSPPAANVPTPQIQGYQPQGFGQADPAALGGIGNLGQYNLYGGMIPQAQGIGQGLVNDPNAQQFQQGAGQASQMGQAGAMNAFGAGGGLYGMAGGLNQMGGQIANTAFDPQSALYARTAQQTQDQTRAGLEARGVDNTPYGAGIEGQNMNNFNIDWQNQQLQRQIAGGGAAGGLAQEAGGLMGQGAGMQSGAAGQFLQASGMPYGTSQAIGQGQLGTLNTLGQFGQQGSQIPQQQVQDYLNYLGWGTGQQGTANQGQLGLGNFGLNQAQQGFNQQQQMFGDIGKIIGTGAQMFMGA